MCSDCSVLLVAPQANYLTLQFGSPHFWRMLYETAHFLSKPWANISLGTFQTSWNCRSKILERRLLSSLPRPVCSSSTKINTAWWKWELWPLKWPEARHRTTSLDQVTTDVDKGSKIGNVSEKKKISRSLILLQLDLQITANYFYHFISTQLRKLNASNWDLSLNESLHFIYFYIFDFVKNVQKVKTFFKRKLLATRLLN